MTKISLERGELYFIGERDKRSGERTTYVKIGLVGSTRTSEDRLLDHRTANPRELVVHAIVPTPLVSWAENTIHKQFGGQRIQGEWFVLDDVLLTAAIAEARALATALEPLVAVIDQAQRLRDVESDGTTIAATDEIREWLRDLRSATARVDCCAKLRARYSDVVTALVEAGEVGAEIATTTIIEREEFDKKKFKESHPELWARFLIEKDEGVRGRFLPSTRDLPSIQDVDPELAAFEDRFIALCVEAESDPMRIEALKDAFLELDWRRKAADLEEAVAEARIQVACGTAESIEDVCTWRRKRSITQSFDRKAFAAAEPAIYESFLVAKSTPRTSPNRKGQDQSTPMPREAS